MMGLVKLIPRIVPVDRSQFSACNFLLQSSLKTDALMLPCHQAGDGVQPPDLRSLLFRHH